MPMSKDMTMMDAWHKCLRFTVTMTSLVLSPFQTRASEQVPEDIVSLNLSILCLPPRSALSLFSPAFQLPTRNIMNDSHVSFYAVGADGLKFVGTVGDFRSVELRKR
jgi:hypothetical protein